MSTITVLFLSSMAYTSRAGPKHLMCNGTPHVFHRCTIVVVRQWLRKSLLNHLWLHGECTRVRLGAIAVPDHVPLELAHGGFGFLKHKGIACPKGVGSPCHWSCSDAQLEGHLVAPFHRL